MIAFKDFKCKPKGFLGLSMTPLQDAVDEANMWLAERCVQALNIETIYDMALSTQAMSTEVGVRVWYQR